MKHSSFFFLIFVVLLSMGCPYMSEVPIDKPSVKVNAALLGDWETSSLGMGDVQTYSVKKKNDFEYEVKSQTKSLEDETVMEDVYHDAYVSAVGTKQFINIKERKEDAKYMLYKLDIDGLRVILTEISSSVKEVFGTSAELKEFIGKYMHLSFFYGTEVLLTKK